MRMRTRDMMVNCNLIFGTGKEEWMIEYGLIGIR